MIFKVCFLVCFAAILVECHPTVYKFNENKVLEPDLVPISSTVIPLPVYQVSYDLNIGPPVKDEKAKKPEGPVTLITVHSKKKPIPTPKGKTSDTSSAKQSSKKVDEN